MSVTARFIGLGAARDPHLGRLAAQTEAEVARLSVAFKSDTHELLELRAFVVGAATEAEVAAAVSESISAPRPVLTVVQVNELEWGGAIGIEAIAAPRAVRRVDGERYGFPLTLRIGEFVVARATPNVVGDLVATTHVGIAQIAAGLAACGAGPRDIVKYNIFYRGAGTADDWAFSAQARAEIFTGPGPATTGIPVPRLADTGADIQFSMLGKVGSRTRNGAATARPDGHWDWPVPLPHFHGNRVQELGFIGGQVALAEDASVLFPNDYRAQTRRAMTYIFSVLDDLRRRPNDLVRCTAFYVAAGPDVTGAIRAEILSVVPAGTTLELSLVGLRELAYEGMVVEIECQFERSGE